MNNNILRLDFKVKSNIILKEMKRLGMSRKEYARHIGVAYTLLCALINMNITRKDGSFIVSLNRLNEIAQRIGYIPEEIFPKWAFMVSNCINNKDTHIILNDDRIKALSLSGSDMNLCERNIDSDDLQLGIQSLIERLTKNERFVIESYYGLNGKIACNDEEIGYEMDLTRQRVRQIRMVAIRRLKHIDHTGKLLKRYYSNVIAYKNEQ